MYLDKTNKRYNDFLIMNWKGFSRKLLWPNINASQEFPWRVGGKSQMDHTG
jgi:hypothetical protein